MSKVCLFGIFDPQYSRNRVFVRGFEENGYEVVLCRVDPQKYRGIKKYIELIKEHKKIKKEKFEHIIVAFPGHTVVWFAYLLFGRRIIFDVFVSLYNSEIEDRATHKKLSFRGFYYWMLDSCAMRLPKTLLIDTEAHKDFLAKKFSIPERKFVVVPVGSDDSVVYPMEYAQKKNAFVVHFHGTGIPLQGIEYIVEAGHLLEDEEDISFRLYGITGQDTNNIKFIPRFSYEKISDILSEADVCLGIFGRTSKAGLVIPNKAHEAWATQKPLITARSKAIEELVIDGKEALLCNPADPEDLASKIMIIKKDAVLRENIAKAGYALYAKKLTPAILVEKLLGSIEHNT